MTRTGKLLLLVVPVAAALGVAGWQFWGARADTRAALPTHVVAIEDIEDSVSALGALQPLEYVDVGTQVSGQLQKIHVVVGDKVKEGQLLAEIDPAVFQAKVSAGEAQLLSYRAQIAERQAQRRLMEQQLKRQKTLLEARATSQDSYDTAEAAVQQVAAQIASLEAQIKQTQATLNGDMANLRYTKIYATMDGTIVSLTARQGQTLNANQSAPIILRIADLDTMTVWTQVSEADIPKLRLGMSAYFTTLGRSDRRWYGMLRQVLPTPEIVNNVVLYNALFDVPNPDHELLPQMSAQTFFLIGEAKQVPVVPMAALRPAERRQPAEARSAEARPAGEGRRPGAGAGGAGRGGERRFVARVMEDGKPVERQVTIGVSNRLAAEVRTGLKAGEEVVIEPQAPRGGPRPPQRTPRL
jgi:macrolide-specific efflux system membrane fusion protein